MAQLVKTDAIFPSAAVRKDLHVRERYIYSGVQQHWVSPVLIFWNALLFLQFQRTRKKKIKKSSLRITIVVMKQGWDSDPARTRS